jgi:hypothetical protein
MSVGLQGPCILFLDHDRFNLTVGGRRRLFQAIVIFQAIAIYILGFHSAIGFHSGPLLIINLWEYPYLFVLRSSVRIQLFIPTLSL